MLRFPPTASAKAFALIAELPDAQAIGETEEEAEEVVRVCR
jgi:hypothetical protein